MSVNVNPLVSVVIPCYNSEKYLPQMIDCLLKQTYSNFEAIFVDDGSSDNTPKIIEASLKDVRIKFLRQSNQYAGIARNRGMSVATGEYIIFFDSDDLFDEKIIEILLDSIQTHNSDVAVCNLNYIDEVSGQYLKRDVSLKKSVLKEYEKQGYFSSDDLPNEILAIGFSGPYNKLCKRSFLGKNGIKFQGSKRDNDLSFSHSVMAAATRISWVYDSLYTYRINNVNSLQGFGDKEIDIKDVLSTVVHSKNELIRLGKYDVVKYSFIKQILSRWHYLLEDQQNNFKNYKIVYDCIKNELVNILELDINDEYCFLAYRRDYKKILKLKAEEYLFWKYKVGKVFGNQTYIFERESIPNCYTKIVIYGYGLIGQAFVKQIEKYSDLQIVGIFDKQFETKRYLDSRVVSPENIENYDYDAIIIAMEDVIVSKEIIEWLIEWGVPRERIIWNV